MPKYPKAVDLPDNISKARATRYKEIVRSAAWGASIRCSIIIIELIGVYMWGSSSLLMDALSSMLDVASTLFLLLCFKLARKPPDRNHPFGHGRLEPLGGLQLGLLLFSVGGWMFFSHLFSITVGAHQDNVAPYLWILPLGAVILLEGCYQLNIYNAKKNHSPALAADAYHYRIDAITSLFASIALIIAAYFPQHASMADHLGALCISIVMIVLGLYVARQNIDQVIDRKPEAHFFTIVRNAALNVKEVKETEKIRIQLYGPDAHVDIDVEVDPDMSVSKAHKISQHVRASIIKAWPAVQDVTVHIEPYYPNDH